MSRAAAEQAQAPATAVVGEENKFRLVVLTAHRARQLHGGARPRVETNGHKMVRVALLEVMAGMVSWSLLDAVQRPEG